MGEAVVVVVFVVMQVVEGGNLEVFVVVGAGKLLLGGGCSRKTGGRGLGGGIGTGNDLRRLRRSGGDGVDGGDGGSVIGDDDEVKVVEGSIGGRFAREVCRSSTIQT